MGSFQNPDFVTICISIGKKLETLKKLLILSCDGVVHFYYHCQEQWRANIQCLAIQLTTGVLLDVCYVSRGKMGQCVEVS